MFWVGITWNLGDLDRIGCALVVAEEKRALVVAGQVEGVVSIVRWAHPTAEARAEIVCDIARRIKLGGKIMVIG